MFAGFLVFDAWIANMDRHAINWAVLEWGGERRLAPSFDHGSALASGSKDEDLPDHPTRFAHKGMAKRFENGAKLSLVDLAHDAVERGGQRARVWVERVASCEQARIDEVLNGVSMSEHRRTVLSEILRENQRRLRA